GCRAAFVVPVAVGSTGFFQRSWPEKNTAGDVTWYAASSERCTLNRPSGYRMWLIRSPEISSSGVTAAGKIFDHALRIGSSASHAYRVTVPSYASTVALTELRM